MHFKSWSFNNLESKCNRLENCVEDLEVILTETAFSTDLRDISKYSNENF